MSSWLFVAMRQDGLEDPQTRNPIQINELKSHATRFAHAKLRQKRLNALKGSLVHFPTTHVSKEQRETKTPSTPRQRPLQPRQSKAETETSNKPGALPLTVLDFGEPNPFCSQHMHEIPPIMQDCLDYGYNVLYPTNCPAIQGELLQSTVKSWRRHAMETPVVFYSQVSNIATLCLAMATDPAVMRTLSTIRVLYQAKAISLIQEALAQLVGPPSVELLSCIMNIHGQGTQMYESCPNQSVPESPIFKGFNLKHYGRFAPARAHFPALVLLAFPIKRDSHRDADLCAANISLTTPTFPLLSSIAETADIQKGMFDLAATKLLSTLGTGFYLRDSGVDLELHRLLSVACHLIVAIDEFQRDAPGAYPLSILAVKAIALQHRLLSLSTQSPVSLDLSAGGLEEFIFQIVRLATFIFSDFVFFPTSEARNGRQLLATTLKEHLVLGFRLYSFQMSQSTTFEHLIIWSLTLGGAASSSTSNREWYVQRLFERIFAQHVTWDGLQTILQTFLYYDYVLDKSTTNLWVEVFQSLQAESTAGPSILNIELLA
ncbi:hypothetical protein LTR84_005198 [Exophiala bonariae]|uniref:Uncharacterized protein n=1 Tax=Exophiala bonariae TaxID=1690606 RepID=A0AAV9NRN3_9EURO|nr:hypothetical protein LTR84_005198 [Exophiala bonariae]